MADKLNRLAPIGNLDTDSDPRYVGRGEGKTGDTTQNRNTQIAGDEGSTSGDITPTLGNTFGFDLGTVSAQNKKYRLTFSGDAAKSHQIRLLSTNRDANVANGSGTSGAIPFNGTQADFITNWNASNTANMLATYPTATTAVIEMVAYDYYQFYVESTGTDDIEVVCTQEAIPVDLAGPLKDIGSYDLLGDLFVFSTTQDNEPTELDLTVIAVGPTVNVPPLSYNGPLTFLTFNQPHGLVAGQWIRITNSNAPWLNGLFVVRQVNSATQIGIPTVLAWGGTQPLFTIGSETVRIHPTGIGEIGVAQKDDNTDAWTYTRLLRSVELNFVSRKEIDEFSIKDTDKKSIYFTDNYNTPKVIYHKGAFIQDGLLQYVNSANIYEYDNIFVETGLQLNGNAVQITLQSQEEGNGALPPGLKYYTIRQITNNGNETLFDFTLGPVPVYMNAGFDTETTDDDNVLFKASVGISSIGYVTKKTNIIKLSGLDYNSFSEAELVCIDYTGGVVTANVISRFQIPLDGEYLYRHDGSEIANPIDVGVIIADTSGAFLNSSIVRAKNIRSIDGRAVLSNVTTIADLDLSNWTRTFRHRLVKDQIQQATITSYTDYQIPDNVLHNTGLSLYENYRISGRVYLKGYGWTNFFWIDDIHIDTSGSNSANPNDNRRISGLSDYNLSLGKYIPAGDFNPFSPNPAIKCIVNADDFNGSPIGSYYVGIAVDSWDTNFQGVTNKYSDDKKLLVPKVEFDIDWSYVVSDLSSRTIGELAEAIEFAIGDVPPSVKANGLGVLSCEKGQLAGFPSEIFEFPFHPRTKCSEGLFSYNAAPSHIFNSADRTYIPNYPVVSHNMDWSLSPQFSQPIIVSEERADVVSIYSTDMLLNGADDFSEIKKASSIVSLGGMETKKLITGNDFFIQPAATDIPNQLPGMEPNPGYYSELHVDGTNGVQSSEILDLLEVSDTSINEFSNGETYIRWDSYDRIMDDTFDMGESYSDLAERPKTPVVRLNSPLSTYPETRPTNQNRGLFYAVAYKDEVVNFPDFERTNYKRIGQTIHLSLNNQPTTIKVNGGDSFTCITYHKNRDQLFTFDALNSNLLQEGSTIGFVNQSKELVAGISARTQGNPLADPALLNEQFNWATWLFPYVKFQFGTNPSALFSQERTAISTWSRPQSFEHTGLDLNQIATTYNRSYRILPEFSTSNLIQQTTYPSSYTQINEREFENTRPARICWSDFNIIGSNIDSLRIFLPQAYKDLDLTFGQINHHEDIGGELFTVQPRKYQLQYFNARGTLEASSSSVEVLIGDGSVLSRDGQTLSSYGTQHKWSCIKGLNDNGKDVLYWFNAENGLMMRFGEDGTRVISARGMAAFFANYTKWVKNKDEHAFEQGVRGVWDDRRKEAIWTFTGWRLVNQPWQTGTLVEAGEVVTNTNAPFDTYEEFPRFFRCTSVHQSSSATEPGVGPQWEHRWEAISYTDKAYYSIFTICFNEMTNGFRCFYGHLPKTYLRWQNTFLSSHPVHRNLIFEHRLGEPTTWYGVDTFLTGTIPPKVEDAYFEMVVNEIPEQSFGGVAVDALTENAPDRVEYRTARQYTFDNAVDFEQRDDQFYSCIKNDATLTNNPDSDGEYLRGDFLKVKVFIFGGTYNLFHSIVVKIRETLRRTNT